MKKKAKKKHAAPASVSDLPAGFFDAGVSKKFRPHGEQAPYESSESEGEEEVPASGTVTRSAGAVSTPASLPAGE